MSAASPGRFTGRHITVIMTAFFAIVIAVNVFMATMASTTFGGVVVENSYVASQHFNRWLDEAFAEKALGWNARATRAGDGRLAVSVAGPTEAASLSAVARHPLGSAPDRALTFVRQADGRFLSREALPSGRWRLRLKVIAQGRTWRTEGDIL